MVAELTGAIRDPDGVQWTARLRVTLLGDRPLARVRCEFTPGGPRRVRALWGPSIYAGDGTTGEAKRWALFPGLEYLYEGEASSTTRDIAAPMSERRTPDPRKVTVPLMAVTVGPGGRTAPPTAGRYYCADSLKDAPKGPAPAGGETTVGLFWNPLQKWDGTHALPSCRFSSPNLDEGMANHRMALFVPSVPDAVPENGDRAKTPVPLRAGQTASLEATLVVVPGPVLAAQREWYRDRGGLPKPSPWPRTFDAELDVCRQGLLTTVWDAKAGKWMHCIGWEPAHGPGLAALLWTDAHTAAAPDARRLSAERVELVAQSILKDKGPGELCSLADCHIMKWELPFLYGYLPEAVPAMASLAHGMIAGQQPDGGWRFHASGQQAGLGEAGDSVIGTCTHPALVILRYARLTGDREALKAGEKALRFMERFRLPRGAGTWECPMYAPDLLGAAWAVAAYVEGYRATGNPRWLADAVYWAETGVTFFYQWSLPDRPRMLGASVSPIGSSFYTISWLGLPVQWCGLVYAYHVQHLAASLEQFRGELDGAGLPSVLHLKPADWRRVAELITVSGMYQQADRGPRIGTYPDSVPGLRGDNPPFLNPEDIMANVLALRGHDPDVKTVRVSGQDGAHVISSGATIGSARLDGARLRFAVTGYAGENSYVLVSDCRPSAVTVDGAPLARSPAPVRRAAGWWWDAASDRTYLVVPQATATATVTLELAQPRTP